MTYVRSSRPEFGPAFQLPRQAPSALAPALGLVRAGLRSWQQSVEIWRARRHLMALDDRLLKDIGLNRGDVQFGNLESLDQQRRQGRMQ